MNFLSKLFFCQNRLSVRVVSMILCFLPCRASSLQDYTGLIQFIFISYSYFLFLSILQDDEDSYEEIIRTNTGDSLFKVKRNSEVLGSLTRDRAPPPKNRRRPSLKKRHETSEIFTNSEEELDEVSYMLTNLAP